ncbi:type IV secretion protein Rhs [Agrobacterium rhizogenes]|nr:type IV secretion protein Rhs [Rhizobium rhizogenes]NTH10475.1 type IV secretion protein Rhs [Rhizobium rhizogenes]
MLNDDVGYNVSPSSWDSYPTIGRSGTYITDQQAITDILGPLNTAGETFITIEQQSQLEAAMGLQPGSLAGGFKVRQVTGITEMSPRSPLEGNKLFQGAGQHLPGGGPEMVVDSIPTTDTTSVTTITTVRVK